MSASRSHPFLGWVVLCSCLIFLPGCIPAERPLSDPVTSEIDERLCGVWLKEDDKGTHLFIGKTDAKGNPTLMRMFWCSYDEGSKTVTSPPPGTLYFSITKLNDEYYINFLMKGEHAADLGQENSYNAWFRDENRKCEIMKYKVEGKRLTLLMGDKSAYEAAVKQKEFDPNNTASLVRYLKQTKGEKLFPGDSVGSKAVFIRHQ